MTKSKLNPITTTANAGDAREWAVCADNGMKRSKHDAMPYDKGSDFEADDRHISVKSSGFTLMSSSLCEGETTFDGIWNVYSRNTASNLWAYVTKDFTAYYMDKAEFEAFLRKFGRVERDSEKNGGAMKIRLRKESKKMLTYLAGCVA
jgi:hypothetical protein